MLRPSVRRAVRRAIALTTMLQSIIITLASRDADALASALVTVQPPRRRCVSGGAAAAEAELRGGDLAAGACAVDAIWPNHERAAA